MYVLSFMYECVLVHCYCAHVHVHYSLHLLCSCSTPNHLYLKQWSRYCKQISPEDVQSVLIKVLNPVKDLMPFPSTESSVPSSTQTATESKGVSESSSGSTGESLVKESFPDVTDLKLVPLPPLPPPSSAESGGGGGGGEGATPDFLIDECSFPKSEDGDTLSPPMQNLPPLPVSSCLTTPTVVTTPTVSLSNIDKEVKKSNTKSTTRTCTCTCTCIIIIKNDFHHIVCIGHYSI